MEVYIIKNNITNRVYIGQTIKDKFTRFKEHIEVSNKYYNHPFYNSIRKHGSNNFTVETLKVCDTVEELNYWEEYYIKEYDSIFPNGYNLLPGGNNRKHNQFSIEKIKTEMRKRATTTEFREKCIKPLVQYSKSCSGREQYRKLAVSEWKDPEYIKKQQEIRKNLYTEEWKNKVTSTTKTAMRSKNVREKYLKGYLGFLIKSKRVYTDSFLKFSEELKMLNRAYLDYCSNAFLI